MKKKKNVKYQINRAALNMLNLKGNSLTSLGPEELCPDTGV